MSSQELPKTDEAEEQAKEKIDDIPESDSDGTHAKPAEDEVIEDRENATEEANADELSAVAEIAEKPDIPPAEVPETSDLPMGDSVPLEADEVQKVDANIEGVDSEWQSFPEEQTEESDAYVYADTYQNDDQALEDEEDLEAHPLDELTDQQVIDLVQEVETENRHLYLENNLFESFLKENDPSLLDGFEEMINFLVGRDTGSYVSTTATGERRSSYFDKRYRLDSYTSITSIAEGKGPKINLAQKTEMVMRAMEESQSSLESFLKKCHITKRNLKAELEEFSIREAEFKEATEIFEYSVVTQGVDKLTQRIPAEKFIRYMEEWLKSAQLQIEKLRLRIATLKVQYKKVSQQLIQRQELGENVHAVDFDQLEIENKHFIEKIEQKNVHLVELKKMNGGANLILSTHKKFLQKQQEDCNKLKLEIDEKNSQIEATDKECIEAELELAAEMDKFENCKKLKNQYTVPDVMDYVRLKGKLHDLRKNIKIWIRRRKIQDIALNTCLREMKNLTGRTDIDPSWFDDVQSISEGSVSEDMLL